MAARLHGSLRPPQPRATALDEALDDGKTNVVEKAVPNLDGVQTLRRRDVGSLTYRPALIGRVRQGFFEKIRRFRWRELAKLLSELENRCWIHFFLP